MTIKELAEIGRQMRAAQNQYFRGGRLPADLQNSRVLERAFDLAVAQVLNPPAPSLFDREGVDRA